jgi:hypothetical protein
VTFTKSIALFYGSGSIGSGVPPLFARAGCLLCKPHKLSSAKKAKRKRDRRDAMLHELRATQAAR